MTKQRMRVIATDKELTLLFPNKFQRDIFKKIIVTLIEELETVVIHGVHIPL